MSPVIKRTNELPGMWISDIRNGISDREWRGLIQYGGRITGSVDENGEPIAVLSIKNRGGDSLYKAEDGHNLPGVRQIVYNLTGLQGSSKHQDPHFHPALHEDELFNGHRNIKAGRHAQSAEFNRRRPLVPQKGEK